MDRFPHLNDTDFPDVEGVNAWEYKNNFDYSKYDQTQMTVGVCSVPWDVGLIHVGNAQIGGLGNVVDFESKEARDAYIDGLDGYKWETKFRSYHDDGYIEVPLPYDKCVLFNYVYVEYTLLPVDYAEGGKERFFFFIRSCESLAPSTCKVTILRDTWQTFIYDIDVSYMMLERGHAPMAITNADRYLANPIDNTKYLLADDVTYGDATTNRYTDSAILNAGDMWAVIVMTGSLWGQWGEKGNDTWQTPAQVIGAPVSGQPSVYAYALDPQDLDRMLVYLDVNMPQAVQTIKGVFFVARNLVELTSTAVAVGGVDTWIIAQKTSDIPLLDLAKSQFGYGPRYENIAKLYTSPYAHLEITDEAGNVNIVKIEDTTGQLSLQLTTALAYPWLSLDGRLSGIGKGGGSVSFRNVTSHTFDFDGAWYDHLHRWSIPTFAVVQSAAKVYDYSTHFDREQRADEIATSYGNAVRSADAAKASADASDNTAYTNAVRSADAAKASADATDNTAYGNAVRSADAAKASADATDNTAYGNAVRSAETAKVNADSAALTTQTNTNNSALTAYNNSMRSAATSAQNIYDSNTAARDDRVNASKTAKDNAKNLNQAAKDNQADAVGTAIIHNTNARASAGNKLDIQETKMDADLYWDHASSAVQAALSADLNMATMVQNSLQQGAQAAVSGAQMGAIAGAGLGPAGMAVGALASAGAGLIGSAATTAFAANNYAIVVSNDGKQVEWNYTYMSNKTRAAKNYNRDMSEEELDYQENMMRNNNALSTATTNRSVNASNQAASDTHNTEVANADRDKAVSDSNATRSKNTSDLNALDEYNNALTNSGNVYDTTTTNNENAETTAKANALDSRNTGLANNTRTNSTAKANALAARDAGLANNARANTTAKVNALDSKNTGLANNARANTTAKANALDSHDTALEGIERDIKQAALGAPVQFGEWAGGETSTTRPQGLFANIVTQSQDAIEQAGDYFLRFGYAVNRSWDFDGFNKMPHFTYWKASDMWISGNNVPDAYLDEIRFYLLGGVCVWRNPDDIGRISIYENN